MNTPVSLEIAKLLKEKGFDKRVKGFYDTEKELHENYVDEMNTKGFANRHLPKGEYSAPAIAEVVMWLYEKHGIWIYSVKSKYGWLGCVKDYSNEDLKLIYTTHSEDMFLAGESDKWYNSPTEAYLQAIEYTLKNLI